MLTLSITWQAYCCPVCGKQKDPAQVASCLALPCLALPCLYGSKAYAWYFQGMRKTHSEFRYAAYMNRGGTRALHGWSAIGDASNSDDCLGHGTHTAGSAGGLTYGVAKNASLWAGIVTPHTSRQQHPLNIALFPSAWIPSSLPSRSW